MPVKRKTELSRSILIIGLFTLLAVGSWVGFDLYRSATKTTLPKVLQSQMQPLETKVDQELLDDLQGRQQYDDFTLSTVSSVAIEVPTGTPALTPIPTTEIEPATTETATQSALLSTPTPEATNAGEIQL